MLTEEVTGILRGALPAVAEPWEEEVHSDWLVLRLAAVLVLLFPGEDGAHFLLTRRPDSLRSHPGQISLPGGRVEAEDLSPWHAALRETWEEIRVIPERIAPVGRLCPVQVTVSNNLVIPFVGSLSQHPSPAPSSAEVEEVFEVPVSSLLDPSRVEEDTWVLRDGRSYVVTYYRLCDYVVWGVTARILSDLAGHLGARQGAYPPGSVRPAA